MKYEKLDFQITVPVASFQNSKIGATVSVDETEDVFGCFLKVKKDLEQMARLAYPHLYSENINVLTNSVSMPPHPHYAAPPIIEVEKEEPKTQKEKILQQISECKDVRVLETFRLLVRNDFELQEAYEKRMHSLTTD